MSDSATAAFGAIARIKSTAATELEKMYAEQTKILQAIIGDNFRFGDKELSAKLLNQIDIWSKQTAKKRNEILARQAVVTAKTADLFVADTAVTAFGFMPPELLREIRTDAATIMKKLRRSFRVPGDPEMGALSKNWWKWGFSHNKSYTNLTNALARNAALGIDAVKAGTKIWESGAIKPGAMPQYLKELQALASEARRGNLTAFQKALTDAKKRVDALGRSGIDYLGAGKGQEPALITRGFKKKFLREVEAFAKGGSQRQLAKSVAKYAEDQAIRNARTLQRSATNMIFQQRVVERTEGMPFVKGYEWMLAPIRAFEDVCDDYAAHDEGLGIGVHAPGNVPPYPHYN